MIVARVPLLRVHEEATVDHRGAGLEVPDLLHAVEERDLLEGDPGALRQPLELVDQIGEPGARRVDIGSGRRAEPSHIGTEVVVEPERAGDPFGRAFPLRPSE